MKLPRRLVAAVAAAAVTVLGLAGCAISSDAGDDGVTLTFWQYYGGPQAKWLEQQTAAWEQKNPGVHVKLVKTVGSEQDQKLLASVSTGSTPDLFLNNIVVDYPALVAGGVAKDLTPYWNAYSDADQFPESAVWKTDGKVYNLMTYTNLLGLYYNTDILKAVGISTPPTTLEELQSALAKVKADGRYQGIALSGAPTVEGAWLFAPQLLGEGIGYCNFSGGKVDTAFDRVQTWAKAGYTPKATATWDQNAAWQQFFTGKYAFGINGNWQLGNAKTAKFGYGTAQFPASSTGKSIVYPGGEGFGIGAKSKHADLAWKYLEDVILSKSGEQGLYEAGGSIPVRADLASSAAFTSDELVAPFVKAAQNSAKWPNNENTANVQTALGKAVSSVISGQTGAKDAAATAEKNIEAALQKGGGSC